jgi:hypothetical protein
MEQPVCADAGAVSSVALLVRETSAAERPFVLRVNVGPLLLPHVGAVARELGLPEHPAAMTPAQQHAVLERLDARVRTADPELWRTKQLSDFCSGVWAQVFGPEYGYVITPVLVLHRAGWVGMIVLLLMLVRRRRRSGSPTLPEGDARIDVVATPASPRATGAGILGTSTRVM